ncbi:LCP family protein [Proteinivorax tanatarense]|uniref:LCP family protein n=1 Tax=Proteinivorax tanatarense TaxID=1260629 RepID=A0AAU7VHZ3_9FIRM
MPNKAEYFILEDSKLLEYKSYFNNCPESVDKKPSSSCQEKKDNNEIKEKVKEKKNNKEHEQGKTLSEEMEEIYAQGRTTEDSNLINTLFIRTNNYEAEYLMITQYNEESEKIGMIILPKETYAKIPTRGYNQLGTSYGALGIEGLITSIEMLLDIDIHYYVKISRSSVREIMHAFESQLGVKTPPAGTPADEAITQMTTDIISVRNIPKYISLILEVKPHLHTNIGPTEALSHRKILYKIPNTTVKVKEIEGEKIKTNNKEYLSIDILKWRKKAKKMTY